MSLLDLEVEMWARGIYYDDYLYYHYQLNGLGNEYPLSREEYIQLKRILDNKLEYAIGKDMPSNPVSDHQQLEGVFVHEQ